MSGVEEYVRQQQSLQSERRRRWDRRFMEIAERVAAWSKDPGTHVGAVLVDEHRKTIVSTGYNGLPRTMPDTNLEDRPSKLSRTIHAEMNAILNAGILSRHVSLTLYVTPLPPCDRCAVHVVQAGITRVVCRVPAATDDSTSLKRAEWLRAGELSAWYFDQAGVSFEYLED